MSTWKKVMMAAAGGGGGLDVDEVFSTFLYEGTGANIAIDNGIDLSGEGGMVWYRRRDGAENNSIEDTVRGLDNVIYTDSTNAQADPGAYGLQAFNSNGFTAGLNTSGGDYVSWTFRKAKKFFDVQTGTCSSGGQLEVNHNLGSSPGMVIVKGTNVADDWYVYHISQGASKYGSLNTTSNFQSYSPAFFDNISSTTFRIKFGSYYANRPVVLYLFAHNNSDGEFGPDGDADIIKCGSYTGNASSTGPVVDLGFEPQWLMVKNANNSNGRWLLIDNMRGWGMGDADIFLNAHLSDAEMGSQNWLDITPTGFKVTNSNGGINGLGQTHIYMAIRRGPLAVPDDATKVFAIDTATSDNPAVDLDSGFPVDLLFTKRRDGGDSKVVPKLTMTRMDAGSTDSEASALAFCEFDHMDKVVRLPFMGGASTVDYMWKRAPSYFDCVGYVGAGAAQTVSHNLGVVPEMMWIKNRDSAENWAVYHSALGTSKYLHLNTTDAGLTTDAANRWNNTSPTATQFTVGTSTEVSHFTRDFIAYLFATVAGVSKVGSFSHTNGSTTDVDCGFSSGARFVLFKRYNDTGSWIVFDSVRGIVAGNDPFLKLDATDAETTGNDVIDPLSSGFQVASGFLATGDWIFYAIA